MKFCKKCMNVDTRPNIRFDDEGVCPVCRYNELKRLGAIDWEERKKELKEIADWGRAQSKCSYDCIVAVSGGKDSMRQSLYVRDELKMKPLLVSCVYPPEQQHTRCLDNFSNLISYGFDSISVSPNPQIWKKFMRQAFFTYGNWCKATELALYSIPIHISIAYQIPLVFLGENPALNIGEQHGRLDGDATKMKYCNTLGGGDPTKFLSQDVSEKDLFFYAYPCDEDMEQGQVRIVYLGYYIEDFIGYVNGKLAVERGLKVRTDPPEQIGDLWGFTGLDEDCRIVNQMIKYYKFGYGTVIDQVCDAINLGVMTREEAVELVRKYDGKCDYSFIKWVCGFLEITEEQFWDTVDSVMNKDLFEKNSEGKWVATFEVY